MHKILYLTYIALLVCGIILLAGGLTAKSFSDMIVYSVVGSYTIIASEILVNDRRQ
jgi:hypothetical protein